MKHLFFAWIFFFTILVGAQSGQQIFGRIISAESGEAVPYASIQFEGTNQGLVSNEDGSFRLPNSYIQKGINLIISSLGFKTTKVNSRALSEHELNLIEVSVDYQELDEVVVTATLEDKKDPVYITRNYTAEEIVRMAISRINGNLDHDYYSYVGYYRDYQIYNGDYYNLNEAIVEIYDQGSLSDKLEDPLNKTKLY